MDYTQAVAEQNRLANLVAQAQARVNNADLERKTAQELVDFYTPKLEEVSNLVDSLTNLEDTE